jgi:hypothetical protein
MGEADTLRRAMGKKDRDLMAAQRAKFVEGCKARRVAEKKAEKIWTTMEKFAGYGFNKCVTADALIEMADGTRKPITDIQAGDLVLTKDGPFTALGVRPSGTRRVGRLRLANGMTLRCTPDHPVFTQRGWVNVENLTPDDFAAVARELPCGTQGECGLRGKTALTKRMPPPVDQWNRDALSILVGKLFKLGIPSTIHRKTFAYRGGDRVGYTVNLIGGREASPRFQKLVGPHLVGKKRVALTKLVASYAGMRALLARGSVDAIPVVLYREPLREAILKRYPSLKAGCRELAVTYGLLVRDRRKRGIRRDTLKYLAAALDSPQLHALADSPIGWSRPRKFVVEGLEPTYDFEVPEARSFIANGIVVHNSHGAAYAMVAYQTAYLKANCPVEFMAALLTSEMGDTDKIVIYIEECRAMGIQVLPPDVNSSGIQFSVVGETIRFGLAAIKNVGEAAIASILKTRGERGRLVSLADFCRRVDLRLVNRRVIESLIKAGAFDSLGVPRAQLLASVDDAMEAGQRHQRDREQGQRSIFDLMGDQPADPASSEARATAGPEPAEAEPPLSEWEPDQRLAYEKEVLGFYVSGHPLARFRPLAQRFGVTSIGELGNRSAGSRITLFGHVTALKEIPTKSGERMAFATLEDMEGSVELTVFPGPFRIAAGLLRSREPILVRGRVDDTEKGRVVLAEEIRPLEGAFTAGSPEPFEPTPTAPPRVPAPQTCRIRVPVEGDARLLLESLKRCCAEHRGRVPLFLHLLLPEHEVVVRVTELSVDPGPELATKVEAILGQGSLRVEYARGA